MISNYYARDNSRCQWNICGWIQYAESGKKLMWRPEKEYLIAHKDDYFKAADPDYHSFEIHIGAGKKKIQKELKISMATKFQE